MVLSQDDIRSVRLVLHFPARHTPSNTDQPFLWRSVCRLAQSAYHPDLPLNLPKVCLSAFLPGSTVHRQNYRAMYLYLRYAPSLIRQNTLPWGLFRSITMRVGYFGVGTSSCVLALGCFVICGHLGEFVLQTLQEPGLTTGKLVAVGFTDGGL